MARVVALVPDLLFGSRVQASLAAAGHDVVLVADADAARAAIASVGGSAPAAEQPPGAGRSAAVDVVIVDLTAAEFDGIGALEDLRGGGGDGSRGDGGGVGVGGLGGARTLAFYSHVDTATRDRAVQAGFDVVVPRSRMAREGERLVADLLAS